MGKPADEELIAAWAQGDRKAGSTLLRRHFDALYRFFANKLGTASEVEDLMQQTMIACVEGRARFRGDSSVRTFLFAIARNTLLKFLRDRKQVASLDSGSVSLADCGLGLSTALGLRREQQLLMSALRHIPIDSQVVLELYFWEQMSAKQVAVVLDTTEAAVRGRLRKAKLELRGALDSLARDPRELSSTVDNLDEWAASLAGRVLVSSSDGVS